MSSLPSYQNTELEFFLVPSSKIVLLSVPGRMGVAFLTLSYLLEDYDRIISSDISYSYDLSLMILCLLSISVHTIPTVVTHR